MTQKTNRLTKYIPGILLLDTLIFGVFFAAVQAILHAFGLTRGLSSRKPLAGIVVCDGNGRKTHGLCLLQQLARQICAIRKHRVGMQINSLH